MRNLIVSITTLFVFTVFTYGQQPGSTNTDLPYKNLLKIKPLNILGGEYGLSYERVLTNKITLSFHSDIQFMDIELFDEKIGSGYQLDLGMDMRYYFSRNKVTPKGWHLGTGIFTSLAHAKIDENESTSEQKADLFGIGGTAYIGYQWIFNNGINIGLQGGLEYTTAITKDVNFSEFSPTIGFSIGYSW